MEDADQDSVLEELYSTHSITEKGFTMWNCVQGRRLQNVYRINGGYGGIVET
jgi:hypothetical protein